jgi:class 3 adenylate cyclase
MHAGEIEDHAGGDISGMAVNLAARVEQTAADGELWVSSTVRDLLLGGSVHFEDRGSVHFEDRGAHTLKGIEGEWRLYAVVA